jgi:hypothetical protein
MAHDVFISYAKEDQQIADAICAALEGKDIKCWYAPRDVMFGMDFEEAIVDAICASKLIILVLSSHSNNSPHIKREIQNACTEGLQVPILPLRVENVPLNKALRYYLSSLQWLDASSPPFENHLHRLVEHVQARLPQRINPLAQKAEASQPEPIEANEAVEAQADTLAEKKTPLRAEEAQQTVEKQPATPIRDPKELAAPSGPPAVVLPWADRRLIIIGVAALLVIGIIGITFATLLKHYGSQTGTLADEKVEKTFSGVGVIANYAPGASRFEVQEVNSTASVVVYGKRSIIEQLRPDDMKLNIYVEANGNYQRGLMLLDPNLSGQVELRSSNPSTFTVINTEK